MYKYFLLTVKIMFIVVGLGARSSSEYTYQRTISKDTLSSDNTKISFPVKLGNRKYYAIGITNITPTIIDSNIRSIDFSGVLRVTFTINEEKKEILLNLGNYEVLLIDPKTQVVKSVVFYIEIDKKTMNSNCVVTVDIIEPLGFAYDSCSFFIDTPQNPFYSTIKLE